MIIVVLVAVTASSLVAGCGWSSRTTKAWNTGRFGSAAPSVSAETLSSEAKIAEIQFLWGFPLIGRPAESLLQQDSPGPRAGTDGSHGWHGRERGPLGGTSLGGGWRGRDCNGLCPSALDYLLRSYNSVHFGVGGGGSLLGSLSSPSMASAAYKEGAAGSVPEQADLDGSGLLRVGSTRRDCGGRADEDLGWLRSLPRTTA